MAFLDHLNGMGCHKGQRCPEPSVEREEKYQQRARLHFQEAKDDIREVGYSLNPYRGLITILDFVRLDSEIKSRRFQGPSAQSLDVVSRLEDE